MAPGANAEGTGESKHVATTTQGHVVVSGDTELKARVPEDMGRLTLLNGDTGELVWEKSFTNASSFTGVRIVYTPTSPTTLLCVHITSCARLRLPAQVAPSSWQKRECPLKERHRGGYNKYKNNNFLYLV